MATGQKDGISSMSIMKRATKQLAEMGLPDLEVHKGLWGYSVWNRTYRKQYCTAVRKTPQEAIQDVVNGDRPQPRH